jgi:hypothetical protein
MLEGTRQYEDAAKLKDSIPTENLTNGPFTRTAEDDKPTLRKIFKMITLDTSNFQINKN